MKKLLLKSILLLCALITGTSAWAADPSWSHTFASPEAISNNSITVSGATWSVSTTAGAGDPSITAGNSYSKYGLKFGSNKNNYYGSVTFTTDYFKNYNVQSVTVKILNNGNKLGTLTAQQGSTSMGSTSQTFGTTWTDLTVNTNAGSGGSLSFTYSVEQAFLINEITVTYTTSSPTQVATPTFSPAAGAVASGTEVTISCATDGATIHYTTDGTDPTSSSTQYNPSSKPTITAATTIKAIGIKDGLTNSAVATADYTIAIPCATPTFSVAAGAYTEAKSVEIACATEGATIHYTTDGTVPTSSSPTYSSALSVRTDKTIKAIAIKDGYANSNIAEASYTFYVVLPFEWDNTSTPIGVTNNNVGTYTSSPYLKFDATGDYIILKFNEVPGTLTFDILGNSFSGGTFKVQTSADGSTYTDLKSYTSLSSSKQSESFVNELASDIRYIKWIYTNKSSGNVALGNIKLTSTVAFSPAKEYTTLTSSHNLNFTDVTGLKAFIATEVDGDAVQMTQVNKVPAGTGLVIKKTGSAASYDVPVFDGTGADAVTGNKMAGSATATTAIDENGGYILKDGVFQPATAGTLAAGKAYLNIAVSARELVLNFDESDVTAISEVTNTNRTNNTNVYDLQGRKVAQPTKGLYIVNGKKVMVK